MIQLHTITPKEVISVLERFTFTATGCTDPLAIVLATSHAYRAVGGKVDGIHVRVDLNIYKNAFCVTIPGTATSGLKLAAAIGAYAEHPEKGLLILQDFTADQLRMAKELAEREIICVEPALEEDGVFVEAEVFTDNGIGYAKIKGAHDNLVEVRKNGKPLFQQRDQAATALDWSFLDDPPAIPQLLEAIGELGSPQLARLLEGIELNRRAAQAGLQLKAGIGAGAALRCSISTANYPSEGIGRACAQAKVLAAAGADARMGGLQLPIMGCFGSGNHGIVLTSCVQSMSEAIGASADTTARALALGMLVTGYVKRRTGILTPHCGCSLAASTGAAAAVCYLCKGTPQQVEEACKLVIAVIFGVICDGAKETCALKMAEAAGCAVELGYAASQGLRVASAQGIVGPTLADTLHRIERLTKEAWDKMDYAIVRLLMGRS